MTPNQCEYSLSISQAVERCNDACNALQKIVEEAQGHVGVSPVSLGVDLTQPKKDDIGQFRERFGKKWALTQRA